MTKIVPKGYADIGAYNEMDDYTQFMEFVGGMVGEYQTSKTNYEKNLLDSLTSQMGNIDKINTSEGFTMLGTSIKKMKDDIYRTGNPKLQMIADQADVIISNYTSDFNNYTTQFSNIVAMQDNPDGIFNPKNLTVENIMSWDPEELNRVYGEVEKMRVQFFKPDGVTPKFSKYGIGDKNSSIAGMSLNNFYKQLGMAFSSLEGSDVINQKEAEYILRADAQGLQTLRAQNMSHYKERIKFYETQGIKSQGIASKLKEKQNKSIFELSQEDQDIMQFIMGNESYIDEIEADWTDLSYTTEDIQNDNASPKASQLYTHLIEQADLLEFQATQGKKKYIKKWDYWSPVLWGDDMSKMSSDNGSNWNAGAEGNGGEPGEPPTLTSELAAEMYNTFDPTVQKQWGEISSDEVDDMLGEHKIEYPEDSGHWYNQKDVYNLVNPVGGEKGDKTSNLLYNQLHDGQKGIVQQWYVKEGKDNVWNLDRAGWWNMQSEEYKKKKLGLLKKTTEEKKQETTIDDFMDNILIDVTKINQDERKYIRSKVSNRNSSKVLTLVRRYKMAKDDSQRQTIKSQIEKLLL